MLLDACVIALVGMGAVFGFLLVLIGATKILSKIVSELTRSELSEIAVAVAFARHQRGE